MADPKVSAQAAKAEKVNTDPTPSVAGPIPPGPMKLATKNIMRWQDHFGQMIIIAEGGYESQAWLLGYEEAGLFLKQRGGHGNVTFRPWHKIDAIYFPNFTAE